MLDLKRFLRFEISGYVAVLYSLLFCLAFYDLSVLKASELLTNVKVLDYSVTGFILSAPIGFIMHQIDISLFSPFREKRWCKYKREVISEVRKLMEEKGLKLCDNKGQAVLEFSLSRESMSHIDSEIGNRYSYYYARMEAGFFSPIFGFLLFLLSTYCVHSADVLCRKPLITVTWISGVVCLSVVLISVTILWYCPTLFREINDLECLAVRKYGAEALKAICKDKADEGQDG